MFSFSIRKWMQIVPRRLILTIVLFGASLVLVGCPFPLPSIPPSVTTVAPPTVAPPTEVLTVVPPPNDQGISLPQDQVLVDISSTLSKISYPYSETLSITVPESAINMVSLIGQLKKQAPDLVNPEIFLLGEEAKPDMIFQLDHPATLIGPPSTEGLIQTVSLRDKLLEKDTDMYLKNFQEWGNRPFLVGAIIVYRPQIAPITYAVLLRNDSNGDLIYQQLPSDGTIDRIPQGTWTLRELSSPLEQPPFTYIGQDRVCFSQHQFQACLQQPLPVYVYPTPARKPFLALFSGSNLIPNPTLVNLENTLAGIADPERISACRFGLANNNNDTGRCNPDFVIAPLTDHPEWVADNLGSLYGIDASPILTDALFGIAAVGILEPINGRVVDEKGNLVVLPPGAYRLDLLMRKNPIQMTDSFGRPADGQLGRLMPADGSSPYYVAMIQVDIFGKQIYPPEVLDSGIDQLYLGSIIDGICTNMSVWGYEPLCESPKQRTPWCIYWGGCP